jgi:hypothetical protein
MKSVSINEFKKMLANSEWSHDQEINIVQWDVEEGLVHGDVSIYSKLDGIAIFYEQGFEFPYGNPNSIKFNNEGMYKPFIVDGIIVLDDDGDAMHELDIFSDCEDELYDFNFTFIVYNKIIKHLQNIDVQQFAS